MTGLSEKYAKSIEELESRIIQLLIKALSEKGEVAFTVKDEMLKKIEEIVYQSYTPLQYERRGSAGGLADPDNISIYVKQDGNEVKMIIRNLTEGNKDVDYSTGTVAPNHLAGIIEYGRTSGLYARNRYGTQDQYMKPRPFTQKTAEALRREKKHIDALIKELNRLGVKAKRL